MQRCSLSWLYGGGGGWCHKDGGCPPDKVLFFTGREITGGGGGWDDEGIITNPILAHIQHYITMTLTAMLCVDMRSVWTYTQVNPRWTSIACICTAICTRVRP